jgi:hypothetical protein
MINLLKQYWYSGKCNKLEDLNYKRSGLYLLQSLLRQNTIYVAIADLSFNTTRIADVLYGLLRLTHAQR